MEERYGFEVEEQAYERLGMEFEEVHKRRKGDFRGSIAR